MMSLFRISNSESIPSLDIEELGWRSCHNGRGGDLGGLGGRSHQNLRWGTAHALVPQHLEKSQSALEFFPIHCPNGRLGRRVLRLQHFCYPTRTRSTRPFPVPVPDPYSKLLPDPTRTRGYTRTRQAITFKRSYAYSDRDEVQASQDSNSASVTVEPTGVTGPRVIKFG